MIAGQPEVLRISQRMKKYHQQFSATFYGGSKMMHCSSSEAFGEEEGTPSL